MISYIIGTVASVESDGFLLESNNIGYKIFSGQNYLSELETGKQIKVYTYMQVREDGIALFGFPSNADKAMFENLISVSGVGPKLAIQISGYAKLDELAAAIATGNSAFLSSIKGIGKKTAERIVLELKNKTASYYVEPENAMPIESGIVSDAVGVLVSLGMNAQEAVKAVNKVKDKTDKIEELISLALKG